MKMKIMKITLNDVSKYCGLSTATVSHGHYVGTYLALTALERYWWGEGEFKFFIDDDHHYPTICGTGTEDYFGGAWAFHKK